MLHWYTNFKEWYWNLRKLNRQVIIVLVCVGLSYNDSNYGMAYSLWEEFAKIANISS